MAGTERTGAPQAPAPLAQRPRMPEFFIVGHSKSGTTALYEMLRAQPGIFMPDLKEPVFFAKELPRQAHRYKAPETLEEYLALFAGAAPSQRLGEASASYLWSQTAAAAIAEAQPSARIISILREPAAFLRSLHMQCVQSHYETEKDLGRALALEEERREGRSIPRGSPWPQVLLYSEHVRYVEQLKRYEAVFPPEQMLTLIYDDFRADNRATIASVLRFLDVREELPVAPLDANPTERMRSQRLDEMLHAVSVGSGPLGRAVKAPIKALLPSGLRRGLLRATRRRFVVAPPDPPDEQLMAELRRRYRPQVEALGEHLGRDLIGLWGYDDVR